MKDLNHQLKVLCARNRDGSHSTQHTREKLLTSIAKELASLGFRRMSAKSLKPKHVEALVARLHEQGLTPGSHAMALSKPLHSQTPACADQISWE
ncbi:phage integrase N-terminal domain-containing protein [Porticoccus sp. W117]|uniref:phage integrase N-terminal domain-containing protein n=1 Tax=Porticoccus sp. W117 TaxID=3054777 RepID=UPI00338FDF79